MNFKKKILVLHKKRNGFENDFTIWNNYEVYFEDFYSDYIAKYKNLEEMEEVVNKDKLYEVIERINHGYDAVFCESPDNILIQFIMLKKNLKLPSFVIGVFDGFNKARIICNWIEKNYQENPFNKIIKLPLNYWFYSTKSHLKYCLDSGIDKNKLFYIPSSSYIHSELWADFKWDLKDIKINYNDELVKKVEGKIIACGDNGRDYKTLINAVANLKMPVYIFCNNPLKNYPENVHIHNYVSLERFYQVILCSKFVVLPLHKTTVDVGIATAGLAIGLGKPVIATDLSCMHDFVINGKNGILVKPYDEKELREAILFLWNKPRIVKAMGKYSLVLSRKLNKIVKKNFKKMFAYATAK